MLGSGFKMDYPVSRIKQPTSKRIACEIIIWKVAHNVIKPEKRDNEQRVWRHCES